MFIDSLSIPLAPNHWQGIVYLDWNSCPVEQKCPEKSEPGAVSRFPINTEKAEIKQKYSALGKKECRPNYQATGEANLSRLSQPSQRKLRKENHLKVGLIEPGQWDVEPMPGIILHCNAVNFSPNLAVTNLLT